MAILRQELLSALDKIQEKLRRNEALSEEELEVLLLGALVEEEA